MMGATSITEVVEKSNCIAGSTLPIESTQCNEDVAGESGSTQSLEDVDSNPETAQGIEGYADELEDGVDSCRELEETAKSISNEDVNLSREKEPLVDLLQESDEKIDVETAVTFVEGEKEEFVDMNTLMAAEYDKSKEKVYFCSQSDDIDTATSLSEGEEEMPRSYIVGDDKPSHKMYRAARRASFYVDKGMQQMHAYYTDYSNSAVSSLIAKGMMAND
ncbi:hypothetical protein Mgra_00003262 [Meloidogyne graminicola]|uniref:Uncharacterized protein n=1 Tax=Meloidogyne graminicola TaxID=189291 RepID=A0A8S9ZVI3_9BILA|nr:hypothetical protein Mgra_00003262 [Meloidogyne graminicola]